MKVSVKNAVFEIQRIFCVGRNYREHAAELNNEIPQHPVIFMKPSTSLVNIGEDIPFPSFGSELHEEVELVILCGKTGYCKTESEAYDFIAGITLGLDLTLRDIQRDLKKRGLPWERAKAFDGSAVVGNFVPFTTKINLKDISFNCYINNRLQQQGNSKDMIFPVWKILLSINEQWKLQKGDIIFTGTPAGVTELRYGDNVRIESNVIGSFQWKINNSF